MRDYRLERLTLRNFKGVVDFSIDARADDREVRGDNATGKTTFRDAIFWLTTGKDSAGRANFEVKTLESSGEATHGLEHEVVAVFVDDDGTGDSRLVLQRTYHEDWRKKRGQAEREFSGHSADYVVNDVPVQKKEFDAVVAETLGSERELRLLMDPEYFSDALAWKDRRAVLLDVCGDVSDDDVIASSDTLSDLGPLLVGVSPEAIRAAGGSPVDALRRQLAAAKRKANETLSDIPVRIDEKQRELSTFKRVDIEALTTRETELKVSLGALQEERTQIMFGGAIAEARKCLSVAESDLQIAETDARSARDDAAQEVYVKVTGARALFDACDRKVTLRAGSLRDHEGAAQATREQIAALEVQRTEAETEYEGETSCPACGQDLPADRVDAAREHFNMQKAARLRAIDDLLERERIAIEAIDVSIQEAEASVEEARRTRDDASERKVMLVLEHDEALSKGFVVPDALQNAVDEAASALEAVRGGAEDARTAIDSKITTLSEERDAISAAIAETARRSQIGDRISELESEKRRLGAQFEEYERQLYMTEEFVRRKVSLLEDRINERFTVAQFKLFDEQVQGGLVECCETTVNGVPFGTNLNHGARVLVGLEIIDVLQQHFDKRLPVFVDQAESVTTLPPMDCQMIRLVVDASARELTVSGANFDPSPHIAAKNDSAAFHKEGM